VGGRDAQRCLPSVPGAFGDAGEQQRTAGDRLQMLVRLRQPYKDVPAPPSWTPIGSVPNLWW
jgi:hypothetical protein